MRRPKSLITWEWTVVPMGLSWFQIPHSSRPLFYAANCIFYLLQDILIGKENILAVGSFRTSILSLCLSSYPAPCMHPHSEAQSHWGACRVPQQRMLICSNSRKQPMFLRHLALMLWCATPSQDLKICPNWIISQCFYWKPWVLPNVFEFLDQYHISDRSFMNSQWEINPVEWFLYSRPFQQLTYWKPRMAVYFLAFI